MFDWKEYHVLGRKLVSQANDLPQEEKPQKEAMFRSAVSRAYYAAYNQACEYLKKINKYPSDQAIRAAKKGSHQLIIDIFIGNPSHPEWEDIGIKLNFLKNYRQMADYSNFSRKHILRKIDVVKTIIDDSEEIIKL